MQFCSGLGVLDVFADHIALEQRHFMLVAAHDQHGHLAERRNSQKPVRLVGEVDVDALEGYALLVQRDHGALNIGAKLVADQREFGGHDDLQPRKPDGLASCIRIQVRCICM